MALPYDPTCLTCFERSVVDLDVVALCSTCADVSRKRAAALALVRRAYQSTPAGAAQAMLEHVLACATGGGVRLEWYAGEAIFARLVLDHAWHVDEARAIFDAVRELGAFVRETPRDLGEVHHA